MQKSNDKLNKHIEVLENIREMVIGLKNQLEESKRIEEFLKIQLMEKEDT